MPVIFYGFTDIIILYKTFFMLQPEAPVTHALFGMFLQDIREIEKRNPRCFRNKYYRYSFSVTGDEKFDLSVEPQTLPKRIEKQIKSLFNARLNGEREK